MRTELIRKLFGAEATVTDISPEKKLEMARALAAGAVERLRQFNKLTDPLWSGGIGLAEYLTEEEKKHRKEIAETYVASTDFIDVAEAYMVRWPLPFRWEADDYSADLIGKEIQKQVGEQLSEFDWALTPELRTRSLEARGPEYTYALRPAEFEAPEDAPEDWRMAQEMKANLAVDPIALEIEQELGAVYNQTLDKIVPGLITIVSGFWHGGGYLAGYDADGYPFFVTAEHCATDYKKDYEITLANGQKTTCVVVAAEEESDVAILRGNEKLQYGRVLPLGSERSPWGLAVAPLYREAELLRYNPTWGKPFPDYQDSYSFVNRGRPGWSGSPLLDSNGRVTGIVSWGNVRGEIERLNPEQYAYSMGYVPIEVLRRLYAKAGLAY